MSATTTAEAALSVWAEDLSLVEVPVRLFESELAT
jgi:hypothetical protein